MDITFSCANCGQNIVIDEEGAGLEVQCPGCRTTLVVPAVQGSESTVEEQESILLLSQICPKCERAWPREVEVCEHCGTSLRGESEPAQAVESGPRVPKPPQPPPAPVTPPPAMPPPLPASAAVADAPPPVAAPKPGEDQYECNNPNCGTVWPASQLAYQEIGRKKIPVCPKCRSRVTKIVKPLTFWASALGAFVYPFKGIGGWVLGLGTLLFAFLDLAAGGGCIGLIAWIMLLGIFGLLLINVIRTTVDDPDESLDWPEFEGVGQVVGVAFQIIITTVLIFLPFAACGLMAGLSLLSAEGDGLMSGMMEAGAWGMAMLGFLIAGIFYYPMALLGVAMFDSVKGINPALIIPAILKTLLQYLCVLILLILMWFMRQALSVFLASLPMWNEAFYIKAALFLPVEFFTLFTLVVSARLLGILYKANTARFGWFPEEQ